MTSERFAPPLANLGLGQPDPDAVRLYRLSAIALAVLFGGALAGGYLVIRNSLMLGRRRDAWGAAALFGALFAATLFVQVRWPPHDFLSQQLELGLPRMMVALAMAFLLQHRSLRAHERAGGPFRSRWLGFALGVATLAVWDAAWIVGAWLGYSGSAS